MPNPIREHLERAQALDLRRQEQIAEQVKIINRLMVGGGTYDEILQTLAGELARYKVERDELARQVANYRQVSVDKVFDELFPGIADEKDQSEPVHDLHSTTDAAIWTDEFFRLHADRLDQIDWGLMVSWFANAIEVGRSAGRESVEAP